jgi:hypothetical protein
MNDLIPARRVALLLKQKVTYINIVGQERML